MAGEENKLEKERLLDEKIKALRLKNAQREQRHREVDQDKAKAEKEKSSITVAPKPKYEAEPSTPMDRIERSAVTARSAGKPRRQSDESYFERAHAATAAPAPAVHHNGPVRSRLLSDADAPPPDPGYRFLADRMREDDEALATKKQLRGGGTATSRQNRNPREGKARDRQQSAKEKQNTSVKHKDDTDEEDCILVSESDKKGNIKFFNNNSPTRTVPNRKGSDKVNTGTGVTLPSNQSNPKIKSLFDDDDEDEYYFPERWKGKEHHPNIFDTQRKIEHTAGGNIMVTRTIDPVARLENEYAKPSISKMEHNEYMKKAALMKSNEDEKGITSPSQWVCSDPACRHLNSPNTYQCQMCKLAFSKSNEYKNNLACDKYKQEFRRQPLTSVQQPQAELIPQLPDGPPAFTNGGSMIEAPGHPAHLHHQFYASAVPEVGNWQNASVSEFSGVTGSDWNMPSHEGDVMTAWPNMTQEMMLTHQQNLGIMISQIPVAATGFTSTNFYEPAAPTTRQLDPSTAAGPNQYFHQTTPEFLPASAAPPTQFVEHSGIQYQGFPPQQATTNQFNPVAPTFVPTSTEPKKVTPAPAVPLFPNPPPLLANRDLQVNSKNFTQPPPPSNSNKNSNPNLLVSLGMSSPPKPVRINTLDPSKHIRSSRNSSEGTRTPTLSVNSRLTDKNTQQKYVPPRFSNKARDSNQHNNYKPPSLLEMQSGTLKKRGGLQPPTLGKGTGLLIFGTSNVVNNLDEDRFSTYLHGIPVRLVPAMKLESFQTVIHEVDPSRDWLVLIHGLGNDARNIALKQRPDQVKAREAEELALTFCDLIERYILKVSSHLRVLISLLLPRYDFEEKLTLSNPNNVRKVVNVAITERFYQNSRVDFINSDTVLNLDNEENRRNVMGSDGYHLTNDGFKKLIGNWIKSIQKITNQDYTKQPPAIEASAENEDTSNTGTETVPDPFGEYSAPVNVLSPNSRAKEESALIAAENTALPTSDTESESDEAGMPSLETVAPPLNSVNGHNMLMQEDEADLLNTSQNALITSEERIVEEEKSGNNDEEVNPLLMESSEGSNASAEKDKTINDVSESNINDKIEPNINEIEIVKPNFRLGRIEAPAADVNGGGEFIEDEYCSVLNGTLSDPLPSMINCSGPESSDFGPPVSGIFLEDSYLPSNIESLSLVEASPKSEHCKMINSEPQVSKLTENGSDNLIET